ncbi:MAG: response regulator, partial [Cyanobacteria bacterium P01_G01_bin.4]
IDPTRIREKAIERGLLSVEQAQTASDSQVIDCLFEPGFSTTDTVSELSGRGIGLDVVRVQLRELKGKVGIASELGQGTTFTLRLPFTLTMTKLLVCTVNSSAVALSSDNIEEIFVPAPETMHEEGAQRYVKWREQVVPIHPLSRLLEYRCPVTPLPDSKSLQPIHTPEHWSSPLLVVKHGNNYAALEVGRLVTEQELAIKPLGAAIASPKYVYGCTVLADGTLVPVVDAIALVNTHQEPDGSTSSAIQQPAANDDQSAFSKRQVSTILVVDDSVAQRRSLIQSCQRAGYRVLQAGNGQEALSQLEQGSRVDGIICDIEMPKMNGFEFLTIRRQNPNFASIPVAMLTSRSSQKHHQLALQLGASAYLTKPYLEQELLATLQSMCETNTPAGVS